MVTKRDWLISQGKAKPGRGKFSQEATKLIEEAEAKGMVFDLTPLEIAKAERAARIAAGIAPKRRRKTAEEKAAEPKKEKRPDSNLYDNKDVRSWAQQLGIEVGQRGTIPTAIVNQYLSAMKAPQKKVVRKTISNKPSVRPESVGYTYAKRKPGDPSYISEPLVAVMTCGGCSRGVSYCGCKSGPTAPKYLGGGVLLLTKPGK